MNWPAYSEYKDSGMEWIGHIPDDWVVLNVSRAYTVTLGKMLQNDAKTVADQPLRYLRAAHVQPNGLSFKAAEQKMWFSPGEVASLTLQKGDVIVVEGGAGYGRSATLQEDLPNWAFQNSINRLRPLNGNVGKFADYCMQVMLKSGFIDVLMGVATIPHLTAEKLSAIRLPHPPTVTQREIVNFLDRETCKIDALIDKQHQLIATLREDRTATITHAVAKGLNPDVEMRNSGVGWLGEVPVHWEVRQLKWGSPVRRGASPRPIDDPKYFDDEGEWSWVRIADVSASSGQLSETTQRLSELGSSLSVRLNPGSLFISIAGTVGKPCIARIPVCIHDGFVYFPSLDMDTDYLYRIFEAGECYLGLGKMGTQLNLNTDTIGSIRLPFPSRVEQREIVEYLKSECGRVDALIAKAVELSRILEEYRSALITAAVTGKIDVREAV